jgi:thioesterase domain-containing protein
MVYRIFQKLGRPVPQRFSTLQDINRFAMSVYRPTLYPGQLIIFRSVTRGASPENDELLGWGGLAPQGIEVHDITGSHHDMLNEPNVRVLAEKLRVCLDRVQVQSRAHRPARPSMAPPAPRVDRPHRPF